jgi:hypothetical protein
MANYTAYIIDTVETVWHFPENVFSFESGYGRSYGRFYGKYFFLPPELWTTAPFYLIAGYGLNYGRFYERSVLPPLTTNIIIWETTVFSGASSHTNNLPVSYVSVNHTAYKAPTLTDVFYNRLFVEPVLVDFGILVSTQSQNVIAWNGFLTQTVILNNLLTSGFDGIEIIGDAPPSTFLPLQERTYEIRASTDGPPNIDAQIRFDWEPGFDDNYVYITGLRIVLYPYLYRTNMIENLEWLTNILINDDGSENRQGLRENPRQKFSVLSFIQPSEHIRADNILYGWRHQTWAIPIWSEGRQPTSAVTALDIIIQVDTRFGDFRVDSLAVIWENERKFDLFTILSLTDTQITLDRGITEDFSVNAIVCPIRTGRMTRHPQRRSKGHNALLSVIFEVDDNTSFSVGASPIVYLTEDTYLDIPDMPGAKEFKDNYIRDIRVVDYKTGIVTHFSSWNDTKVSRDFLIVLEGLEDIWNFRLWLHRRAGKQRPFWMPTFERNMFVTGTGNIGLNIIIREDANRAQGSARDHIYIRMKDGTEYLRAVLSITDIGGLGLENNVTIDLSISENQEDIDYISYMGLKRLDSDRIQLKWGVNNTVECHIPIKEIEP